MSPNPKAADTGGAALKPRHWRALEWFAEKGPRTLFGIGDPALATVKFLATVGAVEGRTCYRTAGPFGMIEYSISTTGRALIAERNRERQGGER